MQAKKNSLLRESMYGHFMCMQKKGQKKHGQNLLSLAFSRWYMWARWKKWLRPFCTLLTITKVYKLWTGNMWAGKKFLFLWSLSNVQAVHELCFWFVPRRIAASSSPSLSILLWKAIHGIKTSLPPLLSAAAYSSFSLFMVCNHRTNPLSSNWLP